MTARSELVKMINKYKELKEEKKNIDRDYDYDIDFTFEDISIERIHDMSEKLVDIIEMLDGETEITAEQYFEVLRLLMIFYHNMKLTITKDKLQKLNRDDTFEFMYNTHKAFIDDINEIVFSYVNNFAHLKDDVKELDEKINKIAPEIYDFFEEISGYEDTDELLFDNGITGLFYDEESGTEIFNERSCDKVGVILDNNIIENLRNIIVKGAEYNIKIVHDKLINLCVAVAIAEVGEETEEGNVFDFEFKLMRDDGTITEDDMEYIIFCHRAYLSNKRRDDG